MKIFVPKDKQGNEIGFRTPESYVFDNKGVNLSDKIKNILDDISTKATNSDFSFHTSNNTIHITADERTKWNSANTHANTAHAPSNAERNTIVSIKKNGTALTIDNNRSINIDIPTDYIVSGSQTSTSSSDAGSNVFTFTRSNGQTSSFTVKNGSKGSTGTRGSQLYWGTGVTGNSTTSTVFSGSGVSSALVNDLYLNTSTWNIYQCTTAGAASVAKWVYKGCIKGATGASGATASEATQSAKGLMSAADKIKLDSIATGAQVNTVTGIKGNSESSYRTGNVNITPTNIGLGNVNNTADSSKSVASAAKLTTPRSINGTSFDGSGNITTSSWGTARNISISDNDSTNTGSATSVNGSGNVTLKLPATIKASLSGNASTATALSSSAGGTTTPIYFKDGKPVACSYTLGKSVPSDAKFTDTTYSLASTTSNGLMSSTDKTKLNGIATGATKNIVDSSLSSTSSNPIANKAVYTALEKTIGIWERGIKLEYIDVSVPYGTNNVNIDFGSDYDVRNIVIFNMIAYSHQSVVNYFSPFSNSQGMKINYKGSRIEISEINTGLYGGVIRLYFIHFSTCQFNGGQ